jgi:formylmethanofuran dehydrogenase subunit E
MAELDKLLKISASNHRHLCPRQVLGIRMGLAGASILNIEVPCNDKRLLVIVETDGCFVSGILAATGCNVNHRTLRIEDYGKVAATFVHVSTAQSIRLAPRNDIRQRAQFYAPHADRRYQAQLLGYQAMPIDELFTVQEIRLNSTLESLLSQPGKRTSCDRCGEEIINGREIQEDGLTLCIACKGAAYYQVAEAERVLISYPSLQICNLHLLDFDITLR